MIFRPGDANTRRLVGRRLTKGKAHSLASRKEIEQATESRKPGRSSGRSRLHYEVQRGFLCWRVYEKK